ncbi:dTDP-4-dehydrorhamnose reductase [Chloroherpeton thalassium ATCC 35110]|uniref:dTDP-4-dehydrorhamnose reductase n=1 Tax=Chloroherpeton thalassium (strain ATCC 35110 / GB-78) TaxID=517418 RepID=B3QYS1_CHLT3|nr:dTDP-4-dehydrorhamnose reductase [Chloroherpeton thalassium]ACF15144.1 dTDP-4-dehydrorhamnose reductase [Chloroherpeton thalassium ATCC 35110]
MSKSYKRVLITGANGLLGQKLTDCFAADRAYDLLATARQPTPYNQTASFGFISLDMLDRQAVKELVWNFEPNFIVNAGAYTNVDGCEKEKDLCWKGNVIAVENLAAAARLVKAQVVHVSTDYIFDGKNGPYDEAQQPNPLSYYGRSKLASENVLRNSGEHWAIIRTMVVYGVAAQCKKNFALWLAGELKAGKQVRIVDDQFGNTTLADDLARGIYMLVNKAKHGVYNMVGGDNVSRYEFALRLAEVFGFDKNLITPIKTADLSQLAERPMKSGLITLKAETELGIRFFSLNESLRIFKKQYTEVFGE